MRRPFAVLTVLGAAAAAVVACNHETTAPVPDIEHTTFASSLNIDLGSMTRTTDGLYYADSTVGTGATVGTADSIQVDYAAWLPDGTAIDSTHVPPLETKLGVGHVIPGWDKAIPGMKVGGWRKLVIPPALGYGQYGVGPIPPNSILVFNVRVTAVR